MDIVMPRLTDSMEEGTVLSWLRQDGDEIAVGDELVEIETDKASMVYESDAAGTLEIIVPEGETKPIGETIATVGDSAGGSDDESGEKDKGTDVREKAASESDDDAGADEGTAESPEAEDDSAPDAGHDGDTSPDENGGRRIKASPLAKRIAADEGIDLKAVEGSGPDGRIVKADLNQITTPSPTEGKPSENGATKVPAEGASGDAAGAGRPKATEAKKGDVETVELDRLQTTISRRMAESKATAPHFYLRSEIDMSRAVEVRAAFKDAAADGEAVPSFNDMVVKATALALRNHPRANGAYRDGQLELYSRINVGIAVAGENSLVVPTIGDADHKDLREIATEAKRLAERVRSGEITPPELAGGTFSVSNLGMFGVRSFEAVINSGQAGILAVGEITERPVVEDGAVGSAHLMEVTLSCDHRILYGAEGAKFLAEIKSNLEEPGLLA